MNQDDLDSIKDLLPREGQSVVITRVDGKLVAGKLSVAVATDNLDEKITGELLPLSEKLKQQGLGCSAFLALLATTLWGAWKLGEGGEWDFTIAIVIAIVIHLWIDNWYSGKRRKQHYLTAGINIVHHCAHKSGLKEYELLGKISKIKELETLKDCMTKYSKEL